MKEYLALFSNTGDVKVRVKFKDFEGTVAHQTMQAQEIACLFSEDGHGFIDRMTIDEWPFEIFRYEIDVRQNILTLHAKPLQG